MTRTSAPESLVNSPAAVVVGGGVAGLTAACFLARGGRSVTLFEQAAGLGGRAASSRVDGYAINRGVHALYTGGAASAVLRELGVTYRGAVPADTFGLLEGRLHRLPTSAGAFLAGGLLGWGDKLELLRLFAGLGRVDPTTLAETTVQQWLDRTLQRPRLHQLMAAFARTFVYSAALDLVSADVFVDKLQRSLKHPIHYVDGGWQTIVDGLRQAAPAAGVTIVNGVHVAALLHRNGRVTGVRTRQGEIVPAADVVLAMPPRDAVDLLEDGALPALRRRVAALVPAQVACLDVALRRLPDSGHPVAMDLDRPLFLTAQSSYADVAPEGAALVHTFKQLDPRRESTVADDERELEGLLDTVQPGWRDVLVHRSFLPRIAAVGALPLVSTGGMLGRPDSQVAGIEHLFVAGDWVGAEGFLADASFASARQAARLALDPGQGVSGAPLKRAGGASFMARAAANVAA